VKIAMMLSYAGGFKESARRVAELEKVGLDLVWVAEAYGYDSPSLMGYIAGQTERVEIGSAILPVYSRTPTLIAMTAAGLDALTDGRFHLGLGASGPQVVEGWHGVAYEAPLQRTRETIEICRLVWAREEPLTYVGRTVQVPLAPERGTGLGKPLKIIGRPVRSRIPVWVAALGEKNVAMTVEMAEGWIPIFYVPDRAKEVWGSAIAAGTAKRDPALGPLQVTAGGLLAIGEGDEVVAVRERARGELALYVGGMGAKGHNFYNDLMRRYGYEKEAEEIQDLYLSGKKQEAEALVPAELLEAMSLCGPEKYVAEKVAAFAEAGVTHLQVTPVPTDGQSTLQLIETVKGMAESF
jgi:F420-dependent oxidoreductase-like protein